MALTSTRTQRSRQDRVTHLATEGDRDRPAGDTLADDACRLRLLLLPPPGEETAQLLLLSFPGDRLTPSLSPPLIPVLPPLPFPGEATLTAAAAAAAVTEVGDPTEEGVRTAATPMAAGSENDPEPPDFGATAPHPDSAGAIDPIDIIPTDIGRRASAAPSHADTFSFPSPSPPASPAVLSAVTPAAAAPVAPAAAVPGRDSARRSSAAARPLSRMDPTRAACLWRCRSRCARAALALAWVWILTAASVSR